MRLGKPDHVRQIVDLARGLHDDELSELIRDLQKLRRRGGPGLNVALAVAMELGLDTVPVLARRLDLSAHRVRRMLQNEQRRGRVRRLRLKSKTDRWYVGSPSTGAVRSFHVQR